MAPLHMTTYLRIPAHYTMPSLMLPGMAKMLSLMAKLGIKHAFCLCPVHPADLELLGIHWEAHTKRADLFIVCYRSAGTSAADPQKIYRLSTDYLQIICRMSAEYLQNIRRMSAAMICNKSADKISLSC